MPHPTTPAIVRHPESVAMVALDPKVDYPADDILVRTFPQFFADLADNGKVVESVTIEQATAEPGRKRTRTKAVKP